MVFRFVIAGVSQCNLFAEICLLAEYLKQNLSSFCYERIEKSVIDWKIWLTKVNKANDWHHMISPLVWKELLTSGSKPVYIGGTQEFLEYCYSYYHFDVFLAPKKFKTLIYNYDQYDQNCKVKSILQKSMLDKDISNLLKRSSPKSTYTVCIYGANCHLTAYLMSGLLELCTGETKISTIYIYDENCSSNVIYLIEKECNYIRKNNPGKLVKFVNKIGIALTDTDLLIIMDHVPFRSNLSIGEWLNCNKRIMEHIALTINICASANMRIIFPNFGPACYNATLLAELATAIKPNNIVVATSDLGMNIATLISEVSDIPLKNIYCPPVWGFVGINHLVDIKTTIHRYDAFDPYDRFTRVKNSTLCIGTLTPEMRTMEYLMYFDSDIWKTLIEKNKSLDKKKEAINVLISVINTIKIWLFDRNPDYIINLGIICDGSFGLTFKGIFSQPSQLINGEWKPAHTHLLPKDSQMNIYYLQDIANLTLKLNDGDLPPIASYVPCACKKKFRKK